MSIDSESLFKIEIYRQDINKIKEELNNIGITLSVIYPDFTGLVEEIKTPHKFINDNELVEEDSSQLLPIGLIFE